MNDDIHINNGYRLRPAAMDEIPVIWEIILQAKAQMYREGKHQWDENYPTVGVTCWYRKRTLRFRMYTMRRLLSSMTYRHGQREIPAGHHRLRSSGIRRRACLQGSVGRSVAERTALRGTAPLSSGRPLETSGHGRPLHAGSLRPGPHPRHPQLQGRHQLRQLLHAARLLPSRLYLLRPHPLRCRRAHGLRKVAVNTNSKFFLHLLLY